MFFGYIAARSPLQAGSRSLERRWRSRNVDTRCWRDRRDRHGYRSLRSLGCHDACIASLTPTAGAVGTAWLWLDSHEDYILSNVCLVYNITRCQFSSACRNANTGEIVLQAGQSHPHWHTCAPGTSSVIYRLQVILVFNRSSR